MMDSGACSRQRGVSDVYKFTGKERDTESGLDMFGARYYGSSLGRFMTPDWAAYQCSLRELRQPTELESLQLCREQPSDLGRHRWAQHHLR